MSNVDLPATLVRLRATASTQVAQLPQYKGHFANYRLVRIKNEVKTKLGLAFARAEDENEFEHTDERPDLPSSGKFVTVWSRRNKVDTRVRVADVEWL